MKLLFDQNISFRIIKKLEKEYPNSKQVKGLGLENSSDLEIWQYSKKYDFSIVTFDSDFLDIANVYGHPPKIIWLRTGNRTTEKIARILKKSEKQIREFLLSKEMAEVACMEIL